MHKRLISVLLVTALLLLSLSGCQFLNSKHLNIGISKITETFSPFFAQTEGDLAVVDMLFDKLLTTERGGRIVYNGIQGETVDYNGEGYSYKGLADIDITADESTGTTDVLITLRDNVLFSDGKPMTADDLLFTYYVLCDSTYNGYSKVKDLDIVGLKNYQTQTSVPIYTQYEKMAKDFYKKKIPTELGADLEDPETWFWTTLLDNWNADIKNNVSYCVDKYASFSLQYIGFSSEEIADNEGLQIALGMVIWGFGHVKNGELFSSVSEKTYQLDQKEYPTYEDFFDEAYAKYKGDVEAYAAEESAACTDILKVTIDAFAQYWGPKDENADDVDCSFISGISRLSDSSISISFNTLTQSNLRTLLDVYVAPLHHYGDDTTYDAQKHQYGFVRNDLSPIAKKNSSPLGSGPYVLNSCKNSVAKLTANLQFWRGAPHIQSVLLSESSMVDRVSDVASGALDISLVNANKDTLAAISSNNIAEKLSGTVITTVTTAHSIDYVGLNMQALSIDDVESTDSYYLRAALVKLMDSLRPKVVEEALGPHGLIATSLFSSDAPIHTDKKDDGGVDTDILTAAKAEALSHLRAAGYKTDDDGTIITAPSKGRMHLVFGAVKPDDYTVGANVMLRELKSVLESFGLTVTISTFNSRTDLIAAAKEKKVHLIADTWSVDETQDLSSRFSTDAPYNVFGYADENMDTLIDTAEKLLDQNAAIIMYKNAISTIDSQRIVVPVCQNETAIIYNTERLELAGMPTDMTRFWNWKNAIETLILS